MKKNLGKTILDGSSIESSLKIMGVGKRRGWDLFGSKSGIENMEESYIIWYLALTAIENVD